MSIVQDRRCVVTGKVPGHSRVTAEQALREAGAIVQSAVGKDTDILVTGDAVGAKKTNAARALGVEIVPWAEAFNGRTSSSSPKASPPPRAPMPTVRQWAPQLCKAEELPAGGTWSYEIKWDGQRGVATINDGQVYLQSRSGKTDLTGRYPDVVEELSTLPNCVLDGELVVLGDELGLLPEGCEPDPVARFIVFDVLVEGDQETTARPLSERREILELLVPGGCYVARSPVFTDGEKLLEFVTEHGLEGIVAKQNDSRYVEGGRGPTWLKIKIRNEQEFVVLGFTEGEGARAWAFGALVLGAHDEAGELVYCGKVGTGWDDAKLGEIKGLMEPLVSDLHHYPGMPRDVKATWLRPELVVQIAFQRFTDDGLLWHPSYKYVREDKEPRDVVIES